MLKYRLVINLTDQLVCCGNALKESMNAPKGIIIAIIYTLRYRLLKDTLEREHNN